MKSSTYCFHMKTKMFADFHIFISVPLIVFLFVKINHFWHYFWQIVWKSYLKQFQSLMLLWNNRDHSDSTFVKLAKTWSLSYVHTRVRVMKLEYVIFMKIVYHNCLHIINVKMRCINCFSCLCCRKNIFFGFYKKLRLIHVTFPRFWLYQ